VTRNEKRQKGKKRGKGVPATVFFLDTKTQKVRAKGKLGESEKKTHHQTWKNGRKVKKKNHKKNWVLDPEWAEGKEDKYDEKQSSG